MTGDAVRPLVKDLLVPTTITIKIIDFVNYTKGIRKKKPAESEV